MSTHLTRLLSDLGSGSSGSGDRVDLPTKLLWRNSRHSVTLSEGLSIVSDKFKSGFVADGPARYLKGLALELNRRRADIERRLLRSDLDSTTRLRLEHELTQLEREHENRKSTVKDSLF